MGLRTRTIFMKSQRQVLSHFYSYSSPSVQAVNDPLSPRPALPLDEANSNPYLKLEILNGGGHCGFMQQGRFFLGRRQGS